MSDAVERRRSRSRGWQFTWNNFSSEDETYVKELMSQARHGCYGREIGPDCGTPHLQGCIYFHNPRTFSSVRKLFKENHVESAIAYSNLAEYNKKSGDFYEVGSCPLSASQKGAAESERWMVARESAQRGDLESIPADIYIRYYRTLRCIAKDHMEAPQDLDGTCGIWIHGQPGVGKSRSAREITEGAYLKMCNKWWDGYQDQDDVIIDDFDLCHKVLGHHLKIWTDRYAFLAETKGGAIAIRPKQIIVTSNYTISQIFAEFSPVLATALERRFKVIHMQSYDPDLRIFR